MKKTKAMYSNNTKMIAIFVAGLAVATLGWYYADRLNVAFGQSADIDVIETHNGQPSLAQTNCNPTDFPHVTRKLNGCEVITHTESCLPVQKYINHVKTRSGIHTYESARPKRRSRLITTYELAAQEIRHPIQDALTDASHQVEAYKHGKTASSLAQDDHFQELVASHAKVRSMHQSVGTSCPPPPQTQH